jgi:single-strand DNA-binding protein
MSKHLNQVILIGNVGKDTEVRTLDSGIKVATFSLATSEGGYSKQDGTEVPEKTQWHNVVAWRNLATLAEKVAKKGEKITVIGSISYREYEKDGVKRSSTDIIADNIIWGKSNWDTKNEPADFGEPTHTDKPNGNLPF